MRSTQLNEVKKLAEDLYVITETQSVHCYLMLGTKKALLFDIGYGYENIRPLIKEITSLPVMLVLSHGDPDHGLGATHFEDVWMHELDYGKLLRNDNYEIKKKALDYRVSKMPSVKHLISEHDFTESCHIDRVKPHFLKDGDVIDLGNKALTVIHTPGHSYGHIMLLDRASGRLFSGDQITSHNIWYFFSNDHQAPFSMAVQSLKKVASYEKDFKDIFSAHGRIPIDYRYIEDQLECLEEELKQNYKNDDLFPSFMGNGYQHRYKTVNLIYSDERLSESIGNKVDRD